MFPPNWNHDSWPGNILVYFTTTQTGAGDNVEVVAEE